MPQLYCYVYGFTGPNDLLIVAIARAYDAVLVTNNTQEFSRVANLHLTDWQQS